jgi:DNA-binding CsgD family transcriptional regulator
LTPGADSDGVTILAERANGAFHLDVLRGVDARFAAGERDAAREMLARLWVLDLQPQVRVAAIRSSAAQALWSAQTAEASIALRATFDHVTAIDPGSAVVIGLHLSHLLVGQGSLEGALAVAARARGIAADHGDVAPLAAAQHALVAFLHGDRHPLDQLAPASLRAAATCAQRLDNPLSVITVATLLDLADRTDEALAIAVDELDRSRRRSAAGLSPFPLLLLGSIHLATGATGAARAFLEDCVRLCGADVGGPGGLAHAHQAVLAAVAGDRGRCQREAHRALHRGQVWGRLQIELQVNRALALVELGEGKPGAAVPLLRRNRELQRRAGLVLPTVVPWAGDLAYALAAAGHPEEAREVAAELEAASQHTCSRWGRAAALRARALLERYQAEERLRESIALLPHLPFERARSELLLGDHLRRAGRMVEARHELTRAADRFRACGAFRWQERASSSLRGTGGQRARRDANPTRLTEQERQVAMAVIDGATNKQVAVGLFLSEKTVEYHLAKVYRKLSVSNRTQLARLLSNAG